MFELCIANKSYAASKSYRYKSYAALGTTMKHGDFSELTPMNAPVGMFDILVLIVWRELHFTIDVGCWAVLGYFKKSRVFQFPQLIQEELDQSPFPSY